MPGERQGPGEPRESQEQQLAAKLAKRMDGLGQATDNIANELRERGLSERGLAAFVSMHESVNHLADNIMPPETQESFLKALQFSLFAIASEVKQYKHGRDNIARNSDILKDKLLAALKEVLEMDNKIR